MNKAVLIIDMPSSCVTCPLSFYNECYNEHQCRGMDYYGMIEDYEWQRKQMCGKDLKPDWCPLLPFPERELLWHENGKVVMTGGIKK